MPVNRPTREEMMKCVVFHAELKPNNDTYFDSNLPGNVRTAYHYLRYSPPADKGLLSPAGETAKPKISHLNTGFGMGLITATPGNGVPFHNHDTGETFMCLEGRWRLEWYGAEGVDSVEIGKYDLVSFPAHMHRRFEAVATEPGKKEAMLLGMISGDAPGTEFAPEVLLALRDMGIKHPIVDMQLADLDADLQAQSRQAATAEA